MTETSRSVLTARAPRSFENIKNLVLVEVAGFEPASLSDRLGLLRA